jgi:hypothetical protein
MFPYCYTAFNISQNQNIKKNIKFAATTTNTDTRKRINNNIKHITLNYFNKKFKCFKQSFKLICLACPLNIEYGLEFYSNTHMYVIMAHVAKYVVNMCENMELVML